MGMAKRCHFLDWMSLETFYHHIAKKKVEGDDDAEVFHPKKKERHEKSNVYKGSSADLTVEN